MRRWIYWFLVIIFAWIVLHRVGDLADFSHILARGQFQWMLAAIGLQILHYFVSSASYRTAFTAVGVQTRLRDLFPLLFGALFVNVVAPTGGASGAALFLDHAARHGQSTARTSAGVLLQLITSMLAFLVILTAGLAYLGVEHQLQSYYIIAALILLLAIFLMSSLLLLAKWRPTWLQRLFGYLQALFNGLMHKIKRSSALSDEWIEKHGTEFIEAGEAIGSRPGSLILTIGILLLAHVLNISVLGTLFLAFSQTISLGSLVAGYAVGILFLIVSITPQGVGVVESIMPVVFGSLGVPNGTAVLTVLAFRGLSFWLPLLVGFFLLRKIGTFRGSQEKSAP